MPEEARITYSLDVSPITASSIRLSFCDYHFVHVLCRASACRPTDSWPPQPDPEMLLIAHCDAVSLVANALGKRLQGRGGLGPRMVDAGMVVEKLKDGELQEMCL